MDLSTKKHVGPVQSELEQTRDTLRRTQKYLAKARKDLIDLGVDVEGGLATSYNITKLRPSIYDLSTTLCEYPRDTNVS